MTHPLKLAYIFDQVLPAHTAESEQLIHTLSALARRGYDCTLFCPASNVAENPTAESLRNFYHVEGRFSLELLHSIFPGPRIPQKIIHPLLCASLLRPKLKSFDLVYSRNIPAIAAALMTGIPAMYDTYRPWPEQYHHALRPLFQAFFHCRHFLGAALHSAYARKTYTDMGIPEEKTLVAYNGYQQEDFTPILTIEQARKKLGLPKDTPIALYSGRMDAEKGVGTLLDLAEKTPECHFIFAGSIHCGEIEKRANLLQNVTILGWLDQQELILYLYAADVLMLPLSNHPLKAAGNTVLPIKTFSYLAAGRAIFAPLSPDTSELLVHGVNAWLVAPDDPTAALHSFQTLIHDSDKIQKIALGARESAALYTWDKRAEKLDEFIRTRLKQI